MATKSDMRAVERNVRVVEIEKGCRNQIRKSDD
jgi:hypothetical protein